MSFSSTKCSSCELHPMQIILQKNLKLQNEKHCWVTTKCWVILTIFLELSILIIVDVYDYHISSSYYLITRGLKEPTWVS